MRRLARPTAGAKDTYVLCISTTTDPDLMRRYTDLVNEITVAADQFEAHAVEGRWYEIPQCLSMGAVTHEEMLNVYTYRMVNERHLARKLYDELLASAVQCPLCGHQPPSTLDHYLPESKYCQFVVLPVNLVPACTDCNKVKRALVPTSAETQTLHPYYDHVDAERWLFAEVMATKPASLRFRVQAPSGWGKVLTARLQYHFRTFHLSKLYSSNAASEMNNIRFHLQKLLVSGGPSSVRAHLQEMFDSRKNAAVNSWQTAAYRAWAESEWFFEGGFQWE